MTADGPAARVAPSTASADRVPPHDEDAERSVLGAMMLSAEVAGHAREALVVDDFYRPAHGWVFEAAAQLYASGQAIDPITLCDQLARMGVLEQVGGRAYVHGLVDSVPSAANADHYIGIVARNAVLRYLIRAAQEIAALGYEPTDDAEQTLAVATEVLYEVVKRRVRGAFVPVSELVSQAYAEFEAAFERKERVSGLPTGFADVDDLLSGMQRGELLILAARPSIGKTAFALNVAVNVAKHGHPAAIFSLEMAGEQLAQRMLCSEADVDPRLVRHGTLDDRGWAHLFGAAGTLSDLDIFVDSSPSLGIVEVQTKARKLFSGRPPGLIVIDYLQLMQPGTRLNSRQQEIAEISRGLKLMAKQLDCPVLALSQLNRAIETRDVKRPQLSDLRECVTGDTLVVLADGRRVPIQELVGSEPEVLALTSSGRITRARGEAVWAVGTRPVYKVALASGRSIRATADHRLFGWDAWTCVRDIRPGDRLALAHWLPEQGVSQLEMARTRGTSYGGSAHSGSVPSRTVLAHSGGFQNDRRSIQWAGDDLLWDRVSSVEPVGEELVYDLTVPGPENWLADGIVSHNSGAIEQDADVVMFLHRDIYSSVEDEDNPKERETELIVAKHRNGPVGEVKLTFFPASTRFESSYSVDWAD